MLTPEDYFKSIQEYQKAEMQNYKKAQLAGLDAEHLNLIAGRVKLVKNEIAEMEAGIAAQAQSQPADAEMV